MRCLVLLLIAWLLAGCAEAISSTPKSPAVVLLSSAGRPSCGAVAVAPHRLLTAAHCVSWGDEREKRYVTDAQWRRTVSYYSVAKVVAVNSSRDLAWLETAPSASRLPFVDVRDAVEGEAVYSIAPAFEWQIHPGQIVAGAAGFAFSSLTIEHGWSGSPVLGADGKLVGIVSACIDVNLFSGTGVKAHCAEDFAILAVPGLVYSPTSENLRDNGSADDGAGGGASEGD